MPRRSQRVGHADTTQDSNAPRCERCNQPMRFWFTYKRCDKCLNAETGYLRKVNSAYAMHGNDGADDFAHSVH
jgi:hypothetical protein